MASREWQTCYCIVSQLLHPIVEFAISNFIFKTWKFPVLCCLSYSIWNRATFYITGTYHFRWRNFSFFCLSLKYPSPTSVGTVIVLPVYNQPERRSWELSTLKCIRLYDGLRGSQYHRDTRNTNLNAYIYKYEV